MKTSVTSGHQKITTQILFSKNFAPRESAVASLSFSDFRNTYRILTVKNDKGQHAQFSWQQNIVSAHLETGYFKEIMNDLGVLVHCNEDSITIINGGVNQLLTVELAV